MIRKIVVALCFLASSSSGFALAPITEQFNQWYAKYQSLAHVTTDFQQQFAQFLQNNVISFEQVEHCKLPGPYSVDEELKSITSLLNKQLNFNKAVNHEYRIELNDDLSEFYYVLNTDICPNA